MKKWFMLALLPLLLTQQEVSATPLPPETLEAIVPGFYRATFFNQDKTGDGTYDNTDITVVFDPSIDLTVASESLSSPPPSIPLSRVQPTTLMNFSTYSLVASLPLLELLNLNPTNPITINAANTTDRRINLLTHTMTASFSPGDAEQLALIPVQGELVCIDLGSPNATPECPTIGPPTAVPAPTSLMLLGIGLLALSVPQRRGKLS